MEGNSTRVAVLCALCLVALTKGDEALSTPLHTPVTDRPNLQPKDQQSGLWRILRINPSCIDRLMSPLRGVTAHWNKQVVCQVNVYHLRIWLAK